MTVFAVITVVLVRTGGGVQNIARWTHPRQYSHCALYIYIYVSLRSDMAAIIGSQLFLRHDRRLLFLLEAVHFWVVFRVGGS